MTSNLRLKNYGGAPVSIGETATPSRPRAAAVLDRPVRLGDLTVGNRIAMAPMTRQLSPGGVPSADTAAKTLTGRHHELTAFQPEALGRLY